MNEKKLIIRTHQPQSTTSNHKIIIRTHQPQSLNTGDKQQEDSSPLVEALRGQQGGERIEEEGKMGQKKEEEMTGKK